MEWIIVSCVVMLIISALVATKFEEIAKMKGHTGYFWWCFLLGPAGWLMVVALPNCSKGPESVFEDRDELPDL